MIAVPFTPFADHLVIFGNLFHEIDNRRKACFSNLGSMPCFWSTAGSGTVVYSRVRTQKLPA